MNLKINNEFLSIIKQIIDENKTLDQWIEVESSDMFQSEDFCGGFDATEEEFCFSYFDENNDEWWFQFSLVKAELIAKGKINCLKLRKSDR